MEVKTETKPPNPPDGSNDAHVEGDAELARRLDKEMNGRRGRNKPRVQYNEEDHDP